MKAHWMFAGVLAGALLLGACGDDDADSSAGDDDDGGGGSGFVQNDALKGGSAMATPAAPMSGSEALAGGGGEPLPALETGRKIIFTANLILRAEDVGRAFNDAAALARSNGGYVEKSQYANDGDDNQKRSASLTIRVPSQNYDGLIASLRTMAGVSVDTEGSNSSEVTEQYTDLHSRQRNLERTEQQYLLLLNEAKTIQDILTVQDRLGGVRSQIEQIQGRLKVLDDLTDFATVNVSLAPVIAKAQEPKDGSWTLKEVFVESWERSFEAAHYAAAIGVVALVVFVWVGIPALVVLFVARRVRRPQPPAEPAEAS